MNKITLSLFCSLLSAHGAIIGMEKSAASAAPAKPSLAALQAAPSVPSTVAPPAIKAQLQQNERSLNLPASLTEEASAEQTPESMDGAPDVSAEKLKRSAAFQAMVDAQLPLSPNQIRQYHQMLDMTQLAVSETANPPPTPIASTQYVKLDPGATPPVIRLSAGFVTSLVFLDVTGQPWPIENYSIGDPGTFNIQWDKESNTMFIQGQKHYSHGNLAIRLRNENTPVMISLISGQRQVDYRVDMQVEGRGPNAVVPIINTQMVGTANPILVNILDGIPPYGSTRLGVDEQMGQAYMLNRKMYVRTKKTVLSPAWTSKVSSPDGMNVYEMNPTSLVLVSHEGQTVSLHIRGL